MSKGVYIHSAVLLSQPREPLPGNPSCFEQPDFRSYIPPVQARRMGALVKRAIVAAKMALEKAGMALPGAVLCGTGLGCMEPTERILAALKEQGEGAVSPTDFMQSTHNTIASTVAIHLGCRGYNCTYSQGDVSFESALLDAFLQIKAGALGSALVLAADEMTDGTFHHLSECGYFPEGTVASAISAALVLSSRPEGALCELSQVSICHGTLPKMPEASRVLEQKEYEAFYGKCPVSAAAGVWMALQERSQGIQGPILVLNSSCPDAGAILLKQRLQKPNVDELK